VVLIVGWIRFFAYFLVIRTISKLINTLYRMMIDTVSFIFIVGCYFTLVSTMFITLFSHVDIEKYGKFSSSARSLFDAMLGNYEYITDPDFRLSFSVLMMVHIFISNIFLLNYLVAILSTVYEIMIEYGEFSYKSNKYEFIEKYSIALLDQKGYCELVVHPPPLNFFALFIMPCIVKESWMKKGANFLATAMFWFENFFYLLFFTIYEFIFCPIILLRVFYNILRLSSWSMLLPFFFLWLFIGPFLLLFGILKDQLYMVKLLCDLHDEEEQFKEKEEDFKKDKIVIYNEIMDVMKSIFSIFRRKNEEQRRRK